MKSGFCYTIVSSSRAYPNVFSITIWLKSLLCAPSSLVSVLLSGKKMLPSRTIQPRCLANWMTSPSESRNKRDLVELMGRLGYARSLLLAISERIWFFRILERGQQLLIVL